MEALIQNWPTRGIVVFRLASKISRVRRAVFVFFLVMQAEQKRHLHSAFGRSWPQEGEPNPGRKQGDKIRGLSRLKLVCHIWFA